MIKVRHVILLAFFSLSPAIAAETPASEASIRELMIVMQSKKMIDSTFVEVDNMMQANIKHELEGETITPNQQKAIDNMRTKMNALFKESMSWDVMEPMFIDIYKQTFTQKEVNGMLVFYKSEPGQALITKMPVFMHNAMQVVQKRLAVMMPKLQQLAKDTVAQMKPSQAKKAGS